MRSCKVCNGPLILLGSLGMRVWCRCRDCGIDQSYKKRTRRRAPLSQYDSRSRAQQQKV
jgi:hypothetical protein